MTHPAWSNTDLLDRWSAGRGCACAPVGPSAAAGRMPQIAAPRVPASAWGRATIGALALVGMLASAPSVGTQAAYSDFAVIQSSAGAGVWAPDALGAEEGSARTSADTSAAPVLEDTAPPADDTPPPAPLTAPGAPLPPPPVVPGAREAAPPAPPAALPDTEPAPSSQVPTIPSAVAPGSAAGEPMVLGLGTFDLGPSVIAPASAPALPSPAADGPATTAPQAAQPSASAQASATAQPSPVPRASAPRMLGFTSGASSQSVGTP